MATKAQIKNRILQYHRDRYRESTGDKMAVNFGRDLKLIGQCLDLMDGDENAVLETIEELFEVAEDPDLDLRRPADVSTLRSMWNELRRRLKEKAEDPFREMEERF